MIERLGPGMVVDGCEIVAELGGGAIGLVYKARETALERDVALKVLRPHLTTDLAFVQRFLAEARAAAQLKHPHIVETYRVGRQEDVYFIAMEYVEGSTLDLFLERRGPVPEHHALDIIREVADALGTAHERGIVHRDIQPHNIMIDAAGHAKVMDFGVARLTQTVQGAESSIPVRASAYMSPEQGEGKPLDARSDIYSLGATLYESLTGKPPFDGDTPLLLMYQVRDREFPKLRDANPDLSIFAEELLARMVAKRPGDRFPSADVVSRNVDVRYPRAPAEKAVKPDAPPKSERAARPGKPAPNAAEPWSPGQRTSSLPRGEGRPPSAAAKRRFRPAFPWRRAVAVGAALLIVAVLGTAWRLWPASQVQPPVTSTTVVMPAEPEEPEVSPPPPPTVPKNEHPPEDQYSLVPERLIGGWTCEAGLPGASLTFGDGQFTCRSATPFTFRVLEVTGPGAFRGIAHLEAAEIRGTYAVEPSDRGPILALYLAAATAKDGAPVTWPAPGVRMAYHAIVTTSSMTLDRLLTTPATGLMAESPSLARLLCHRAATE